MEKKSHFLLFLFFKILFHWQEGLFQKPVWFFFNITVLYFSCLSSIDIDTIENNVHPFHVIVDRNQGFIFFSLRPFCIHEWRISKKKDCWSVNVKSKNEKIVDVGFNNTLTIPLTAVGFSRFECCFSQSLLCPPDLLLYFKLNLKWKTVAVKNTRVKPCPYSQVSYSECPTPYSQYVECSTWYSWVSYSKCPTPY